MAKRRTKKEKIRASLKQTATNGQGWKQEKPTAVDSSEPRTDKAGWPEFGELPASGLAASDLTKTALVAILALIFQFALAGYLNRGGWQPVNDFLQQTISVYQGRG